MNRRLLLAAGALPETVHFTDFASVGNSWQPHDRYRVWPPTVVDIKDEPTEVAR